AADELDAEGIRPTLAAVRKKLGSGSFTTISDAISDQRRSRSESSCSRIIGAETLDSKMALLNRCSM
ncbi:KfrA, partial [Salmonella enterica subsp. enterica serovar Dublin]|uniref:DNA-binding protein n=1 Tax=Salmonella enterica TaxID=28901 RepID=UPI001AD60FFC|nr:KfrA [Salmonella enterica subsp. enterica serovar Dublin]